MSGAGSRSIPDGDAAGGRVGGGELDGGVGGDGEVDGLAARQRLLAAGEHHQRLEQRLGAVGGLEHGLAHVAQVGVRGVGIGERDLDLGADDGQRRPQLVARVGDEATLALERLGEAVEHPVDGVGELAQLVLRPDHRDPLVHALLRDPLGETGDPPDRRQRAAGDDVAERRRDQQRAREGEEELRVHARERRVVEPGRQRPVHLAVHDPRADQEQQRSTAAEQQRVERGEAEAECHTR